MLVRYVLSKKYVAFVIIPDVLNTTAVVPGSEVYLGDR